MDCVHSHSRVCSLSSAHHEVRGASCFLLLLQQLQSAQWGVPSISCQQILGGCRDNPYSHLYSQLILVTSTHILHSPLLILYSQPSHILYSHPLFTSSLTSSTHNLYSQPSHILYSQPLLKSSTHNLYSNPLLRTTHKFFHSSFQSFLCFLSS